MTERKAKSGTIDMKALLRGDEEFLRALVRTALQEVLEAEMTEAAGCREGRADDRPDGLPVGLLRPDADHRIGKPELRVPQDRAGRFSTELFERYQIRSR